MPTNPNPHPPTMLYYVIICYVMRNHVQKTCAMCVVLTYVCVLMRLIQQPRSYKNSEGLPHLPSHAFAHDARFQLGVCSCRGGIRLNCESPPYFTARTPVDSVQKCIPVPNGQLLIKHKSKEHRVPSVVKLREVVAYASHPFPRVGRLIGRTLTVFWKLVVKHLCRAEIISMNKMLPFVRRCASTAPKPRKNQKYIWADLVEMFPRIGRSVVIKAMRWFHAKLLKKRSQKHPLRFFIGKGSCRQKDNCERGDRSNFYVFTFHDMLSYIRFDLQFNTVCKVLSSILMQQTGVPIG